VTQALSEEQATQDLKAKATTGICPTRGHLFKATLSARY
jgi:hypothetical protein